ncbi:MAG: hypothetical protein P8Z68_12260 [Kineosporiaceae bacterium]
MHVTEQGADRGDAVDLTETDLAGGGDLEAHLVLDVGDEGAVALAEFPGGEVDVVLRDDEQGQALRPRAVAFGAGQDVVHDVVVDVGVTGGDEPLDAGDLPLAVGTLHGLGPAGADVGTGIRFGEHHGRPPSLVDHVFGEQLLVLGAQGVQHLGEGGTGGVDVHRRVRPEDEFGDRPADARRDRGAAEFGGGVGAPPLPVEVGAVGLLE